MGRGRGAVAGTKKAKHKAHHGTHERKAAEKEAKDVKKVDMFDPFKHHETMTHEEFLATKRYQGHLYVDINQHLRGDPNFANVSEGIRAQIPHLDALIGKQSLTRGITVHRGIREFEGFDPSQLRAGHVISDKGFMSSSVKRSAAESFAASAGYAKGVVVSIKVPRGSKALPIYKIGTGAFQHEKEILFGRGASYKIKSIRKDKQGIYRARAELQ